MHLRKTKITIIPLCWLREKKILQFKNVIIFFLSNLKPHYQMKFCAKCSKNMSIGYGGDFFILWIYFWYFVIIFPWKKEWLFIYTHLNLLHPRMLCAKFGWKVAQWLWREDEYVKRLRTEGQIDDGRQAIRKAHWSFSSGELNKINDGFQVLYHVITHKIMHCLIINTAWLLVLPFCALH